MSTNKYRASIPNVALHFSSAYRVGFLLIVEKITQEKETINEYKTHDRTSSFIASGRLHFTFDNNAYPTS